MAVLTDIKNGAQHIHLIEEMLNHGPGSSAMISDVRDDDIMILIAGQEGTASLGYAAHGLDKLVVPLTSLHGSAEDVYRSVIQNKFEHLVRHYQVPSEIFRLINGTWKPIADDTETDEAQRAAGAENEKYNDAQAEGIVNQLPRLKQSHDRYFRPSMAINITMLGTVAAGLLWIALFVGRYATIDPQVSFFFMLFLSCTMGSGLRLLVAYQQERLTELSLHRLSQELTIALVVSFGLALIYLIGGFSFTGDVVFFQSPQASATVGGTAKPDEQFARIALSMSLLGLAAGFLLPLQQLQDRLEGFLQQTSDIAGQK